jgi:cytochrome c
MKTFLWAAALVSMPLSVAAQGDIDAGEKAFRQCQTCHVVVNDAGETLAGKKAKTGPNLYGVADKPAGSVEGFRYSKSLEAAGEAGLTWSEGDFVAYVQDPTGFLRSYLEDDGARGKMSYKVRKEQDAHDLWAYLTSLGADS